MQGGRCFPTKLVPPVRLCFPTFQHGRANPREGTETQNSSDNHDTSVGNTTMVSKITRNVSPKPRTLPQHEELLSSPEGTKHPVLQNKTLHLTAWLISGNVWRQKGYQQGLRTLSLSVENQEHEIITTRPSRNSIAGVVQNKLIPFSAI